MVLRVAKEKKLHARSSQETTSGAVAAAGVIRFVIITWVTLFLVSVGEGMKEAFGSHHGKPLGGSIV